MNNDKRKFWIRIMAIALVGLMVLGSASTLLYFIIAAL